MNKSLITCLCGFALGVVAVSNASAAAGVTNSPATDPLARPAKDPGAPLNMESYSPATLPNSDLSRHPFLYAGQYNYPKPVQTIFIVRGGKIVWTYEIPTYASDATKTLQEISDATLVSNGNVTFARKTGAGVVTADRKLIWNYDAPPGCEVHVCKPIGLDRVMIVQNGHPAKLMIINFVTGKTEKEFELPVSSDPKSPVHTQFRRAHMTQAGTFLVAHHDQDKVVEYDANGKEFWSVAAHIPWDAVRLHNGNTLITSHDAYVREVNPKGETVWEFTQKDADGIALWTLPEAARLENGNTLISNWCPAGVVDEKGAKAPAKWPTTVQLLEVTPDKKIVWALRSWTPPADLGPATTIQLLDQPGIAENQEQQR
jgi:hypothetical protein